MPRLASLLGTAIVLASAACTVAYHRADDPRDLPEVKVRPGITVLLRDSLGLVRGKKVVLLTNQTGINESGKSDAELLTGDDRAVAAKVKLIALLAPEHGITGKEDRTNLPSGIDRATRLPIYSLYGSETQPPPDSVLRAADVILIDLQDVGSRTWTYQGAMLYTMRAAARLNRPVVVLDRPNPLTGAVVEGPVLDSALSNADDPAPGKPGLAYALYPIPLRHGMTMAELAKFYNAVLSVNADLHTVPAAGWRREIWFDRTRLPFVHPSPNLPTFESVQLYPALVAFEAANVSVGRGTDMPFRSISAPWLKPAQVIRAMREAGVRGAILEPATFIPRHASDGRYNGQAIPGIRITVADRNELQTTRLAAHLLAALHKVHPNDLKLDTLRFDRLFGSPEARRALMAGESPDAVADRAYGPAYAFRQRVTRYLMY